jgi:DHA1 family tetracycline resistance protein-like MFS transporter
MMNRRSAAASFIFFTVALDMLALGIVIPVWPNLIKTFTGASDATAALAIGSTTVTWAAMQFFAAPILGVLSDRFGRRPIILASNIGTAIDYAIMALAPALIWLYVGRALSGIMSASIPTATAYIVDTTEPEKRAGAFGMLTASFGIGFIVGPALGGWLGTYDPRLPFWVAAGLGLLNFCYGLVVLPESLKIASRRPRFEWSLANPLGSLRLLRSHPELFGIAMVTLFGYIAHESYTTVYVLYGQHRYGWDTRTLGIGLAIVGISSMIVSAVLAQKTVERLGARGALIAGLLFGAIGFFLFGTANPIIFWLAIPVNALWGIANSAEQVLMTSRVGSDEQGQLQGALGALRSLTMIGAPMLFAGTFAYFLQSGRSGIEFPAASWDLAGLLLLTSIVVALRVTRPAATEEPQRTLHDALVTQTGEAGK